MTCDDIHVGGSFLSAMCEKADGYTMKETEIDLDDYIGNLDGELSWGDHLFSLTCYDIYTDTDILSANCLDREGYIVPTELDLDDHIANIDGNLRFE
ncbi:MAG: CVNH domain-containing protein [Synechococcales bacterium]|nr:CVNH domain-containing protein [Synechococcales bacterium]